MKNSLYTTLCIQISFLLTVLPALFAQSNLNGSLSGYVRATADRNNSPLINFYTNITNGIQEQVTAVDIFGVAHSEGVATLSNFGSGLFLDFSSDVFVSSSAYTSPAAVAAIGLSFTATTPVRIRLNANTRASSVDIGSSSALVYLSNSAAWIVSASSNLAGIPQYKDVQFDEVVPAGRYYFEAVASDYLTPSSTFPQTYGNSGYSGALSITPVPEPSTYAFYGVTLFVCLLCRKVRKSRHA